MSSTLNKAWNLLWPECSQNINDDDVNLFGNFQSKACSPSKFYDILCLWWNQQLKQAQIKQLSPNHLKILKECLHFDKIEQISPFLGFYQPKNGTCGVVAALHSIYLSKIWKNANTKNEKNQSFIQLMIECVAETLLNCANSAMDSFEFDDSKTKKSTTWKCAHCETVNNASNVFCEACYMEPVRAKNAETKIKKITKISQCNSIQIVTKGHFPIIDSNEQKTQILDESMFGFQVHALKFDASDIESSRNRIINFLSQQIDFSANFISEGAIFRILLSLLLTHGIDRCKYELITAEYEQIWKGNRDETLVIAPYGFCSQNLVNLVLFGHCRPIIDCPKPCLYDYGFLAKEVIKTDETGFYQIDKGFEVPRFPIWTVLSGTHYTTLFALPSQSENYENFIKCLQDKDKSVPFKVDFLSFNGLPPHGVILSPISVRNQLKNQSEEKENERLVEKEEIVQVGDGKYLKGHQNVERIESKKHKNVFYYEIAISIESEFVQTQMSKSPYFLKCKDENDLAQYFDPRQLPQPLNNENYEYPKNKWRCSYCYLKGGAAMYKGYNDLESESCKECKKPMSECLRAIICKYEHVPMYIRQNQIDKRYQPPIVALLNKRFGDFVDCKVFSECLPSI